MTPHGRGHLLSTLVAEAAERDARGDALVCGDEHLDHEGVATMVARLSQRLRDAGVARGDRVMIHGPKSVESFVAMHASMHAGAIACPVDPMAPPGLVAEIANELKPTAVVLAAPTAARWPADTAAPITIGHGIGGAAPYLAWSDLDGADAPGPVPVLGSDPAYILTTSGSTGRPKNIVHTHTSGRRYAELAAETYGLTSHDRMASVAPFHFDQSTFELYAAPLVGACTVLVPEVLLRFPASVSELMERERVTTWYSVPTILRQLLERGVLDTRGLSALRWVLFGGEVFPPAQLDRLMDLLPSATFSNVYGPAEVNQCTLHHLDAPPGPDGPVPIGRAWPDTELRLVDPGGSTIDGAGRGELWVRSATMMAGYWRRPDLTAAAIHTDTDPDGLATHWYRTGDLIDRDATGLMTFVGRRDRQVKIRGVRIELEAVESAIGSLPGVTGVAVVVVSPRDEPALVAIVEISHIARGLDEAAIIGHARGLLAPAAVPSRVAIAAALPRTTSGKIDPTAAAHLIATIDHELTETIA